MDINQKESLQRPRAMGVGGTKIINPKEVVVEEWVRLKCQYGCDAYGTRLTCPPYSPRPETTRNMLRFYSSALLMIFDLAVDENEKQRRKEIRKQIAEFERELFLSGHYKAFALVMGPCNFCVPCDITQPCKFQHLARPSMEACGIDVFRTVRKAGFDLEVAQTLDSPCRYCALILLD